jgi:hypothetical protein
MARPVSEDPAARAVQIDLLRAASPARRVALAGSLSTSTMELARAAIRRRHPDWDDRDILLEFARVHYGAELADAVRAYLARSR